MSQVTQQVLNVEGWLGQSRPITQILLIVEGSPPVPTTASTQDLLVAEVSLPVTVIATQILPIVEGSPPVPTIASTQDLLVVEATIPLPTARWAGPAAQII